MRRSMCSTGRVTTVAARTLDRAAEASAVVAAAVLGTQIARRNSPMIVPVAQSLTPFLAGASLAAAVVGSVRRRPVLAALAAASAAGLASIVAPAARRPAARSISADRSLLTILHANVLYENVRRAGEMASTLLAAGADVLALSELTDHHVRALRAAGVDELYPFRVVQTDRGSEGVGLWSTLPLSDARVESMMLRPGIVATVNASAGRLRIVLAHPIPPTLRGGVSEWPPSLRAIGVLGSVGDDPTVIVADLNASRWHPPFRKLLASGWRDAHEIVGRGLSTSWPSGGVIPPFIRIDHALVDDRLDVVGVRDLVVPGSDHRGFVVTVALPDRAAP